MTRDFTYETYETLLKTYIECGYHLTSYESYIQTFSENKKIVILRHDVDRQPQNAFTVAQIENKLGVKGSYYFRIVPDSFNIDCIKQIIDLGHEIGYHYEDLTLAKGDYEKAIQLFEKNLNELKRYYPVKTICMHGSPLSKWDNKLLWQKYDYKKYGIIGEPYFDIDYDKFLYLTDTGRSWNSRSSNARDKVKSSFNYNLKSTNDIIDKINSNSLPPFIIQNIHPQRWNDSLLSWVEELLMQNLKNLAKNIMIKTRK